jgi:replicative DNA helicase
MREGVSPGYTAILFGNDPLPLFSHIAAYLSVPARMSVGIVCIENQPDAMMLEMISCVSGIPSHYLRERKVPPPLFSALNIALSRIYNARLFFSPPVATDLKSINSLVYWLKRRYGIKVLMLDSIETLANARGERTALLRTSEALQEICENLGLCFVATSRTASIYKSLRKGAVIDADGYEW